MNYIERIRSLRGLSVFLIFFYHLGYFMPGGYIGVDIFFIISGYLIFKIIIKDDLDTINDYKKFFIKRFNRLTPVLLLVTITTIYLSYFFILPHEAKYLSDSLNPIIFYFSNLFFIETTNYFNTNDFNPLLHTWSLAVEFQFYIFIIIFYLVIKLLNFHTNILILAIILLSLLFCQFGGNLISKYPYVEDLLMFYHPPNFSFFHLSTRLWEFFIGVYLANNENIRAIKFFYKEKIELLALIVLILFAFLFDSNSPHPSLLTVLVCLCTVILIINNESKSKLSQFLDSDYLKRFGDISYSFYLWHLPAIYFVKNFLFENKLLILSSSFFISLIFSIFTFKFIEKRFRSDKLLTTKHMSYYSILLFLFIITSIYFPEGVYNKQIVNNPEAKNAFFAMNNNDPNAKKCRNSSLDTVCFYGDESKINFAAWGDSHLNQQIISLTKTANFNNFGFYEITTPGCAPIFNTERKDKSGQSCNFRNNQIKDFLLKKNIKNVIIHAYWGLYIDKKNIKSINGNSIEKEFLDTINFLIKNNIKIFIISSIPVMGKNVPEELIREILTGRNTKNNYFNLPINKFLESNSVSLNLFKKVEKDDVVIVHPYKILCEEELCKSTINNKVLYRDNNHLNLEGAKLLEPLYFNLIK